MYQNNVSNQYKENAILTMRPEELTLTLYNGLIKFLLMAEESILEKKYDDANKNLVRAQDIICEFIMTLDMKYPVSNGLALMYDYMHRRLTEANVKKDVEIVCEITQYSKELRDTWEVAIKISKEENSSKNLKIAK